jgi:signal transduction histidine kinase/CheY-like chemotaxis protein
VLDDTTTHTALYPYVEVAEEHNGKPLTYQGGWHYHPQIGYTQSTYWARFEVISHATQARNWYVLFRGQDTSMVWAYSQPTHDTLTSKPSALPSIPAFRMPAYKLTLTPEMLYTVYLQVTNPNIPLSFELELRSADNLLQSAILDYLFYGAILGGMLALAAYNFLTFLKLREASFLSLSLFILTSGLELSYLNGLLNHVTLLGAWYDNVPAIFTQLAVTSGASFVYHLLDIPRQLPAFTLPFKALISACLITLLIAPFVPYDFMMAGILALIMLMLSGPVIVILSLRKRREAQNSAWAFIVITLSTTPLLLIGIGVIDNWPPAMDLTQLGIMAFMILLSLTQAERTRDLREQSQRAEAASLAKGEFLASMSHEIRTPMNAVINTGTLLQQTALTTVQRSYVDRLDTAAHHMMHLINDILDLSRLESTQPILEQTPFTLGAILTNLEQLLAEHATQKNLSLQFHSRYPRDLTLLGDPMRLSQILLNLLNNSLKFTEQGQVTLRISTTQATISNPQHVELHFSVTDTGCGLSAQQQQRLFEPFAPISQSHEARYRGTGLGLSISSKLVAAMGGTLSVESSVGKGSRFFFSVTFALHTTPAPPTAQQTTPPPLPPAHILLVDDDPMNQFFGRELLQTLGIKVSVADSGAAAIQQVQHHSFDLVFMDVSMPEMNGYETTQHIRQDARFHTLPIIALTAHAIAGERERCLAAGMNDYLPKPFELDQIRAMLQQWITIASR